MKIVIVPNELRDAINQRLDAAFAACPGAEGEVDREHLYQWMLAYYDERGELPEFRIQKVAEPGEGA